jgi:hypothetical protein
MTKPDWAREKVAQVEQHNAIHSSQAGWYEWVVLPEQAITLLRAERARARRVVRAVINDCPYTVKHEQTLRIGWLDACDELLRKLK